MRFAADTHSLFWYLENNPKLSEGSRTLFDDQTESGSIVIPTIALAELAYILRKLSLRDRMEKILQYLENEDRFEICPLSKEIIRESIPLSQFEIHDALIVATALHLGVPLMTRDEKIRESGLVAILKP